MAELILVRHAQASFGADNYDQLSELGFQQAHWLGEALKEQGLAVDRVAIGSLRRHRETYETMAETLGWTHPVEVLPGLNEYESAGILDAFEAASPEPLPPIDRGDRRSHFRRLREAMTAWRRGDLDAHGVGVAGYEPWSAFAGRVEGARAALCDFDKGERVLAVSSGGPISQIVKTTLDASDKAAIEMNLQLKNTSLTRFVFARSGGFFLSSFNVAPHFDRPDRASGLTWA